MHKMLAVVLPAALLGGCAFSNLDHGLSGLVGQDVHAVTAQLGAPSAVRTVGEMREVEWRTDGSKAVVLNGSFASTSNGFLMQPQLGFTPSVGPGPISPAALAKATPASPTTLGSAPQYCKVVVQVDRRDVIRTYRYDGNFDGCYAYGQLLGNKT
jgi:hypothetical protein